MCYTVKYRVPQYTSKWARYINKKIIVKLLLLKSRRVLPNRLTPFNSKIHYKKENYLKVKTVVFKYITLLIVSSVRQYIILTGYITFLHSKCPAYFEFYYMTQLPLVPQFHQFQLLELLHANSKLCQLPSKYLYHLVYKVRNNKEFKSKGQTKDCK